MCLYQDLIQPLKFGLSKIGMWSIVQLVAAQRTSRNQPAGTLEPKNQSLNAEVYSDYI